MTVEGYEQAVGNIRLIELNDTNSYLDAELDRFD